MEWKRGKFGEGSCEEGLGEGTGLRPKTLLRAESKQQKWSYVGEKVVRRRQRWK